MAVDEMDFGDFLAEKTRHAQSAVHGLCESDASTQPFPLDSLDLQFVLHALHNGPQGIAIDATGALVRSDGSWGLGR